MYFFFFDTIPKRMCFIVQTGSTALHIILKTSSSFFLSQQHVLAHIIIMIQMVSLIYFWLFCESKRFCIHVLCCVLVSQHKINGNISHRPIFPCKFYTFTYTLFSYYYKPVYQSLIWLYRFIDFIEVSLVESIHVCCQHSAVLSTKSYRGSLRQAPCSVLCGLRVYCKRERHVIENYILC